MVPCSLKIRQFLEFYDTLWDTISPNYFILVKATLKKVDLDEIYTQKEKEKFKKVIFQY